MSTKRKSPEPKKRPTQRKVVGMRRPSGMSKIDWRDLAWLIAKVEKQDVSK